VKENSLETVMSEHVKHTSMVEFESEVLRSDAPVLVDFYATWCMPCQMLAPALDRIAKEFSGRLKIVKVDVDQEPHHAAAHHIKGVTTLKLFHQGRVVETFVGLPSVKALRAKLEQVSSADTRQSAQLPAM
jgi:thioredoxin 1